MRRTAIAAALVALALSPSCTGGDPSPPSMRTCTPGAFCEGAKLLACASSGTDAALVADCAQDIGAGFGCFTTDCGSATACCRQKSPTCSWALQSPAVSGSTYLRGRSTPGATCSGPVSCGTDAVFFALHAETIGAAGCGTGDVVDIVVHPLTRSGFPAGDPVLVTNAALATYSAAAPGRPSERCNSWNGTVRVEAYPPSWRVTLDLTCAGASSLALKGTFSGDT